MEIPDHPIHTELINNERKWREEGKKQGYAYMLYIEEDGKPDRPIYCKDKSQLNRLKIQLAGKIRAILILKKEGLCQC